MNLAAASRFALGVLAGAGALALLAACSDDQISNCFESNATRYPFHLSGDTSLVFRWPASYMPVRVYAEPAGTLPATTQAGLELWVNATRCGETSFQLVTDSSLADIIVRNPALMPPVPAGMATVGRDSVGACFGRTDLAIDSTGTLVGPMRSYVAPNSGVAADVAACYRFTVAHELGHAIGLLSHSPNPADLMNTVPRRFEVSINDRFTLETLYHRSATILPPPR